MQKLRQIIRLYCQGTGIKTILGMIGTSRNTIKKYIRIWEGLNISHEAFSKKSDAELASLFSASVSKPVDNDRRAALESMFPEFSKKLGKKGVTRELLHKEYMAAQSSSFASQEPFKTHFILGVNFMPEWQIQTEKRIRYGGLKQPYGFSPNVGLSFEARITRHSGIETGFYYRTIDSDAGITTDGLATHYPAGYRRYFSIPLLYRYYSRIVNVGVGISYDIMFKESEIAKEWDGKNRVGIMLKVSKDITLYKGLFMEPEFHFNPFWEDGEINHSWIGLALGLKYRF